MLLILLSAWFLDKPGGQQTYIEYMRNKFERTFCKWQVSKSIYPVLCRSRENVGGHSILDIVFTRKLCFRSLSLSLSLSPSLLPYVSVSFNTSRQVSIIARTVFEYGTDFELSSGRSLVFCGDSTSAVWIFLIRNSWIENKKTIKENKTPKKQNRIETNLNCLAFKYSNSWD